MMDYEAVVWDSLKIVVRALLQAGGQAHPALATALDRCADGFHKLAVDMRAQVVAQQQHDEADRPE